MRKYLLGLFMRVPKHPKTKGDVLRIALKWYLMGRSKGLCNSILDAILYEGQLPYIGTIETLFPLFNFVEAWTKFGAEPYFYWWPIREWKPRYKYMKWLINQYKDEKI